MIYSRTDLTGERPLPLLLLLLPRLPLTAKRTHRLCGIPSATAAAVLAHTLTCTLFSFLLFFFYKCCSCLSGWASVSAACLVHLKGH